MDEAETVVMGGRAQAGLLKAAVEQGVKRLEWHRLYR